jgi:hypothetical protein
MVKTPLRMVLEKAVREKGKETATPAEKERLAASKAMRGSRSVSSGSGGSSGGSVRGNGVLGESGVRGNAQSVGGVDKGKRRERGNTVKGATTTAASVKPSSSTTVVGGLGRSTGSKDRMDGGREKGEAAGLRVSKSSAVWR